MLPRSGRFDDMRSCEQEVSDCDRVEVWRQLTETVELVARPRSGESANGNDTETVLYSSESAGGGSGARRMLAESRSLFKREDQ